LTLDLADIVNAADIFVRDLARDADLVVKASQQIHVAARGFGKKFERHRLAQDQIVGAKHFAHPAFTQPGDDAIAAGQKRARREPFFG
jgi:hypothetical protein